MSTQDIIASNNKGILNNLIPSRDLPIYCNSVTDPNAEPFHEPIKPMGKIVITKTLGKWLVNGKPYYNISDKEKVFFDEFILAMKWEQEMQQHDNNLKKQNGTVQKG